MSRVLLTAVVLSTLGMACHGQNGNSTGTVQPTGCANENSANNGCVINPPVVVNPPVFPIIPIVPIPDPTFGPDPIQPPICPVWGCNPPPFQPVPESESVSAQTKDVDLQRAQVQEQDFNSRAQLIADQFDMNYGAAVQMTELSDVVREMTSTGTQLTAEDRTAITNAAYGIAGVTAGEVNSAVVQSLKGDDAPADELFNKAAKNLGMSSSAALRDKLLPSLGIQTN